MAGKMLMKNFAITLTSGDILLPAHCDDSVAVCLLVLVKSSKGKCQF